MTDLNLLYDEVEDDLRSAVAALLTDRCPPDAVRAAYDGDRSQVEGLWSALGAELGTAGLLVPEEYDGAGASAREAAVVLEESGRHVAPTPFLTSAVVATTALLAGGSVTPAAADLLRDLATGKRTAALLVPFAASPQHEPPRFVADGEGRVAGRVTSVAGALEADVLLAPIATSSGLAIAAVPAVDARVEAVVSLDMSRPLADITLDGSAGEVVVPADRGAEALRAALVAGAGLIASEQLGIAQWCLRATVAYLEERRQFGRVVGSFQALKHRLADLYVEVESAAAAARYAAATLAAGDPDAEVAALLAKAYCGDAAVHAAEEAIQLHGGIGMTWEHPAHLYLKRAKADQLAFGTSSAHRSRLAQLVDIPAPA
jgi:alkylation response protein AidB-like acyl-CoA dehydrogenase